MSKRKRNMIGHDPLAWIEPDDADGQIEEVEEHPLGLDVENLVKGYEKMEPCFDKIAEAFYADLFEKFPQVKPLFKNSDIKVQQGKLVAALKLVASNINNVDKLADILSGLGKKHQSYGAVAGHYTAVAETLLAVLKKVIGRAWNKNIDSAWANALDVIASVMLKAYTELPEKSSMDSAGNTDSSADICELVFESVQDISNVKELYEKIERFPVAEDIKFDAAGLERIDGATMQLLYALHKSLKAVSAKMKIINVNDTIRKAAALMGLQEMLG